MGGDGGGWGAPLEAGPYGSGLYLWAGWQGSCRKMLDGSLFVPQSRERSTQHTMTNIEKNIRIKELTSEANNLRRGIDRIRAERARLDGKVNPHFIEGLDIAIDQAEDRYIAVVNQINALRA